MSRMFTVGEIMTTNSPHVNVGNCNSTTLSKIGLSISVEDICCQP